MDPKQTCSSKNRFQYFHIEECSINMMYKCVATFKNAIEPMVFQRQRLVTLRLNEGFKLLLPITWLGGEILVHKRCQTPDFFINK